MEKVEPENPELVKVCKQRLALTYKAFIPPQHENFGVRPQDLIIGSIPKSGTSWLQNIVHQIRTHGDIDFESIFHVVPVLGSKPTDTLIAAQQDYQMRIYKAQFYTYEDSMKLGADRYINIVRDPVDQFWSSFKFFPNGLCCKEISARDFYYQIYRHLADEECHKYRNPAHCAYFRNMASWAAHWNDANVLWVHFEDLIEDLGTCIDKIANFMSVKLTDGERAKVLKNSSTAEMKANPSLYSQQHHNLRKMIGISDEEIKLNNVVKVRSDGGRAGAGAEGCPQDVKLAIQQQWKLEVTPVSGCDTYADMLRKCSLLKQNLKKS